MFNFQGNRQNIINLQEVRNSLDENVADKVEEEPPPNSKKKEKSIYCIPESFYVRSYNLRTLKPKSKILIKFKKDDSQKDTFEKQIDAIRRPTPEKMAEEYFGGRIKCSWCSSYEKAA